MTKLISSLKSWETENFKQTLKKEMEILTSDVLPLNKASCQGGMVDDSNISVLVHSVSSTESHLKIKTGIFFYEIIAGCNCNDAPIADNTYCEVLVSIDRKTAEACFSLLT